MIKSSDFSGKRYNQRCGLAYALDVVGDRWTLLIVRELLFGPRRYRDLQDGLPGIASNLLADRLKRLKAGDVVRQRRLPPPAGSVVYELTDLGWLLRDPILALGRFGARFMGSPSDDEPHHARWLVLGMQVAFRAAPDPDLRAVCDLHLDDDVLTLRIADAGIQADQGAAGDADVTVHAGVEALTEVLAGRRGLASAVDSGDVHLSGAADLFPRVAEACSLTKIVAA